MTPPNQTSNNARGATIPPRVLAIMIEVSERHGIAVADLLGGHSARFCGARREAIHAVADLELFCGKYPSTPQMGVWFGRHHTTILWALGRTGKSKQTRWGQANGVWTTPSRSAANGTSVAA